MTGVHTIPAATYHADQVGDQPTLSASIINVLLNQSPAHAKAAHPRLNPDYEHKSEERFDVGTVCHSLLLEGEASVEIVDAPDWRTKWAQEARDVARQHGRIPLLGHHYDSVKGMVAAVVEQIGALDIDPLPLVAGKPEQTIVWEEQGVACRARIDWLHDDGLTVDDLKTSTRSANPHQWTRTNLYSHGCDTQCAFYKRGLKAVTGKDVDWRWIVVEVNPPYALSVISPGPDVLAFADAKIDHALEVWKRCLETNEWPGYPTQVCYAELPPWLENQWLEQRALEEAA